MTELLIWLFAVACAIACIICTYILGLYKESGFFCILLLGVIICVPDKDHLFKEK